MLGNSDHLSAISNQILKNFTPGKMDFIEKKTTTVSFFQRFKKMM